MLGAGGLGLLLIAAAGAADFREVARTVEPSVATVQAHSAKGTAVGSGFVVGDGTVLVTNFHVVRGMSELTVAFGKQPPQPIVGVIATDPDGDLALIRLAQAHPALALTPADEEVGAPVLAVGNPRGLGTSFTDGMLSSEHRIGAYHVIQHSAPISPGNSGGPLLDERGVVLGVNSFQLANDHGQNVNFAVGVRHVQALLDGASAALGAGTTVAVADAGQLAIQVAARPHADQPPCVSPTDPEWPFERSQKLWAMAEVHSGPKGVCREGRVDEMDQVFARHRAPAAADQQATDFLVQAGWTETERADCRATFTLSPEDGPIEATLVLARNRSHLHVWVQGPDLLPSALCGTLQELVQAAER